jgi:hypothetical protein
MSHQGRDRGEVRVGGTFGLGDGIPVTKTKDVTEVATF